MEFAQGGGTFGYRPNAVRFPNGDDTGFSAFKLVSVEWIPKFESFQNFSLELKLRLVKDL